MVIAHVFHSAAVAGAASGTKHQLQQIADNHDDANTRRIFKETKYIFVYSKITHSL